MSLKITVIAPEPHFVFLMGIAMQVNLERKHEIDTSDNQSILPLIAWRIRSNEVLCFYHCRTLFSPFACSECNLKPRSFRINNRTLPSASPVSWDLECHPP